MLKSFFTTSAFSLLLATSTAAQVDTSALTRSDLSRDIAEYGLQTALKNAPEENPFAKGALAALAAIETTVQNRWRYNIGQDLANFPLMRLPLASNPNALPTEAGTLSNIFKQFQTDISAARAYLETAQNDPNASFSLRLGDLWFDMDDNGQRDAYENAATLIAPLILSRRQLREARKNGTDNFSSTTVTFDAADVHWLLAYTHVLSGAADLLLAFDPTEAITQLATQKQLLKDAPTRPMAMSLEEAEARLAEIKNLEAATKAKSNENRKKQRPLSKARNELRKKLRASKDAAEKTDIKAEMERVEAELKSLRDESSKLRLESREQRTLKAEIYAKSALQPERGKFQRDNGESMSRFFDVLYIATQALRQNPDPDRITSAHGHFLAMIDQNKQFWEKVALETDNNNEWIPNPSQTSALGFDLPAEVGETWQAVLADAENVLNGDLLVPHYLLPEGTGINLKKYVENPSPIDLIPSIHGITFYPYVEKGPRITNASWATFNRMTSGRASAFALFFN